MACNSPMLDVLGITDKTEDPEGGVIQRRSGSSDPTVCLKKMPCILPWENFGTLPEEAMDILEAGIKQYARAGITTAQDCATGKGTWQLLDALAKNDRLPVDVIAWPLYKGIDDETF